MLITSFKYFAQKLVVSIFYLLLYRCCFYISVVFIYLLFLHACRMMSFLRTCRMTLLLSTTVFVYDEIPALLLVFSTYAKHLPRKSRIIAGSSLIKQ